MKTEPGDRPWWALIPVLLVGTALYGVGIKYGKETVDRITVESGQQPGNSRSTVPVAVRDLPAGEQVELEHVRFLEMRTDQIPAEALTDYNAVVGKIPTTGILQGEFFRKERWAPETR